MVFKQVVEPRWVSSAGYRRVPTGCHIILNSPVWHRFRCTMSCSCFAMRTFPGKGGKRPSPYAPRHPRVEFVERGHAWREIAAGFLYARQCSVRAMTKAMARHMRSERRARCHRPDLRGECTARRGGAGHRQAQQAATAVGLRDSAGEPISGHRDNLSIAPRSGHSMHDFKQETFAAAGRLVAMAPADMALSKCASTHSQRLARRDAVEGRSRVSRPLAACESCQA